MSKKDVVNVEMIPHRDESFEKLLKRFSKKVKKERILEDIRSKSFYMKPSVKKRLEKKQCMWDYKKLEGKKKLEEEKQESFKYFKRKKEGNN